MSPPAPRDFDSPTLAARVPKYPLPEETGGCLADRTRQFSRRDNITNNVGNQRRPARLSALALRLSCLLDNQQFAGCCLLPRPGPLDLSAIGTINVSSKQLNNTASTRLRWNRPGVVGDASASALRAVKPNKAAAGPQCGSAALPGARARNRAQ